MSRAIRREKPSAGAKKNPGRKGRVVVVVADRYWRSPARGVALWMTKASAEYYAGFAKGKVAPVFLLPADAASVERMASQIAECIAGTSGTNMSDDQVARAALAAIGIGAPGKGGGK